MSEGCPETPVSGARLIYTEPASAYYVKDFTP